MISILGTLKSPFGHNRPLAKPKRRPVRLRPNVNVLENRTLLASIINLTTTAGLEVAYGINDSGQVVGYGGVEDGSETHALLYNKGKAVDITPKALGVSEALAINSSGQVTGWMPSVASNAFVHAFLYSDGVLTDLGTLPDTPSSVGTGINASGQIAGYTYSGNTSFLYSHGSLTELPLLAADGYGEAAGINDSGQVVGYSYVATPAPGAPHAYLYSGGETSDLGTLPGADDSYATAINNAGAVVGYSQFPYPGTERAFLDDNGVMSDISVSGQFEEALGINNLGQVVGLGTGGAVLYSNGVLTNLNSLLPANSGWSLTQATAINNEGQIIGIGEYIPTDTTDAFLLNINPPVAQKPVIKLVSGPNPSTFGQSVTFTATVSSATAGLPRPTGTVIFKDGSTAISPAEPLNGPGFATFTTSTLAIGTHSITAVYSGNSSFSAITSSPVPQVVDAVTQPPVEQQFKIDVTIFIPGVYAPNPRSHKTVYAGDNHGFGPAAASSSYRARQEITVITGDQNAGLEPGSEMELPGTSRLYKRSALNAAGQFKPGSRPIAQKKANGSQMHVALVRASADDVVVHMTGNVSNALERYAPGSKWTLDVEINTSGPTPQYTISGLRSEFPAFEIDIDNTEIVGLPPRNVPFFGPYSEFWLAYGLVVPEEVDSIGSL